MDEKYNNYQPHYPKVQPWKVVRVLCGNPDDALGEVNYEGTFTTPLRVGFPFYFDHGTAVLITSRVRGMMTEPDGTITFLTNNSVYRLSPNK